MLVVDLLQRKGKILGKTLFLISVLAILEEFETLDFKFKVYGVLVLSG